MSHRPLYHNTTYCKLYLIAKYVKQEQTLKERRRRWKKAPPSPVYGVAILKSDVARNENGACAVLSLRHCIVVRPLPV